MKALDENGEEYILEGTELLARAILHETEHLDGILYVDKTDGPLVDNAELAGMTEDQKEDALEKAVELHEADYEAHAAENEEIEKMAAAETENEESGKPDGSSEQN